MMHVRWVESGEGRWTSREVVIHVEWKSGGEKEMMISRMNKYEKKYRWMGEWWKCWCRWDE